ncbi:uncharacterized protein LOC124173328 [Ischnura elegans]|uniref:uncharacterized protein LOC124173328 n=1 Tax=Ischnura elegans TaxID=197161 RepID=UPI001ED8B27C|nr:uncharacterized protein LOC124173328 [Ischnura elegans]
MASNISASGTEKFVEERIVSGLLTGSFLQHKELLDMLKDVDVRYPQQRTLLHVGVGLGKADWVEELLARGADTGITDDSQQSALSSAEEMVRQYPDDVERSKVLNLVTLVHRRDQVILGRHVTPVASPECDIASLKYSVDSLRREMKCLVRQLRSSLEDLKAQVWPGHTVTFSGRGSDINSGGCDISKAWTGKRGIYKSTYIRSGQSKAGVYGRHDAKDTDSVWKWSW